MELLPGESLLLTSNDQKLILTSQRIQMTDTLEAKTFTVVIFLENISSVVSHNKGNVLLAIAAAAFSFIELWALAFGIASLAPAIFLVVGGVLLLLWWFSVKKVITIVAAGGAKLHFAVGEMPEDKIAAFMHTLQLARQKRVQEVSL